MRLGIILIVLLAGACNDSKFRPETLTKSRPLGAGPSPAKLEPGAVASIVIHWAAQKDTTPTFKSEEVLVAGAPMETTTSVFLVESYTALDYWQLTINWTVPADVPVVAGVPFIGTFSAVVDAEGFEVPIVGKFPIYAVGDTTLTGVAPMGSINAPVDTVPDATKSDLTGSITPGSNESHRVGWLVPNGQVQNRRDITTKWQPEGAGNQTIVLVVKGRTSQAVHVSFRDIVIQ